jgi:hypothetical protein
MQIQSYKSKGREQQGKGSFCKDVRGFNGEKSACVNKHEECLCPGIAVRNNGTAFKFALGPVLEDRATSAEPGRIQPCLRSQLPAGRSA